MRIAKACVTAGAALYKEAMEPSLFKLLVLTMLADTTVLLTIGTTIHFQLTGVLIPTAITGTLSSIYLIGCLIAAFEARHFGKRFESKVRNAEIIGLHPVEVERIVSGLDPLDKSQRIVDGFNPNRRRPGLFSRLCGCLWRILCCGRRRGPRVDHYAVEYALFTLCRSRGLVGVFERERREHALRLMPLSRSLPFVRLLRLLSYQPEATPLDLLGRTQLHCPIRVHLGAADRRVGRLFALSALRRHLIRSRARLPCSRPLSPATRSWLSSHSSISSSTYLEQC